MDIQAVMPLLQDVFGARVAVVESRVLKDKLDYAVWSAVLHSPDISVVIKIGGPQARYTCAFERLAAIYQLVQAHTSLTVPDVLAADESYQKWPWRYFIRTFIPGEEWAVIQQQAPPEELAHARGGLGVAVAGLHAIHFPAFGNITSNGQVDDPQTYPDALRRHASQIIRDPAGRQYFLDALKERLALFQGISQPGLVHEDLHIYNILLRPAPDGWQIATLLDFEKAWAGHRESDLARMDLWGMTGPRFWQAYQSLYPLDDGYTDRRPVYQLLWCLEYAKQTTEHLNTTQAVCKSLDLPPITSFQPLRVK